ncbi:MAG: alpha/beta hydrolase [Halobacteriovorax sp.]|nr:alpha/beta hydrolase [Halobacteriovorax sp.]|tara:strand:+ start:136758 stop:137750 length:993 start_codon:yes stop_codon:yes gene_type:complete
MPLIKSTYVAPKLFKNGHIQTIYPVMFRKVEGVETQRVRIDTHDDDFIDIDVSLNGRDHVAILSHGLEGSSVNPYVQGMMKSLSTEHFDVIAWNYRSCSGVMNKQRWFYNANNYSDLELVISWAIRMGYKKISLIGFSFGGSLTSYYLGDKGAHVPSEIVSAMLISSPLDIEEAITNLTNWHFGKVYTESFLSTMRKKVIEKHELMGLPGIDVAAVKKAKSFRDFDNLYTAKVNGFETADEYYRHASSINLIGNIKVPTLILNAQNDPFLGENSYPEQLARNNPNIFLETPKSGGHVGFVCFKDEHYWSERRARQFLRRDCLDNRLFNVA